MAALTTWTDGPTFDITFENNLLVLTADIPENMWLGLQMDNDLVVMSTSDADGIVTDLWSESQGSLPEADE